MLVHLPVDHSAEAFRDGLIATMGTLPARLCRSRTWGQGAEMARPKTFSMATDLSVYGPEDLEHIAQELNAAHAKRPAGIPRPSVLRDPLITT